MNPWLERVLWAAAIGVLLFLWNQSEGQNRALADLVVRQSALTERQTAQLDSLYSVFQSIPEDEDLALKQSLMDRSDLLGGRFRIISADDIRILNDRWAYARFEDGHFLQAGLFRYDRTSDGRVRWTLVERMEF